MGDEIASHEAFRAAISVAVNATKYAWKLRGGRADGCARRMLDDVDAPAPAAGGTADLDPWSTEANTAPVNGGVGVDGEKLVERAIVGPSDRFVRGWIAWGKATFPGVWRKPSEADRRVIEVALCREMRARSVRHADIARVKDRIVLGVLTPSQYEVEACEMERSAVLGKRQREALSPPLTWFQWLFGHKGPGLQVAAK
jgi:hypothetical protein